MNKKEFKELGKYIRFLANEMGLKDWHLELMNEEPTTPSEYEGTNLRADASCTPTPGQKYASLRFIEDFFEVTSLDKVRYVVVHELLHCHFAFIHEHARSGLLKDLGQSSYDMFMMGIDTHWEVAIDGIARSWAESLQLIKLPKKEKPGNKPV